jgi:hypothetical protein
MRYISMQDYLGKVKMEELTPEQVSNLNTLIPKVNQLLEKFGSFRMVTSGLRTMEDHLRIYENINAKRKATGLPQLKVPMSSRHLICAAVDLEDRDGKLKAWIKKNESILEELDLYCEAFEHTPNWVHVQCLAPKSGKRFFKP